MLIGERVKIPELSCFFCFFSYTCLFLKQFFDYFVNQNLLHDFFPPNVLPLSKYFNTIFLDIKISRKIVFWFMSLIKKFFVK